MNDLTDTDLLRIRMAAEAHGEGVAEPLRAMLEAVLPKPETPEQERKRLRDFFACGAMQGLVQFLVVSPDGRQSPANERQVAEQAYAMADAMLEARKS